MDSFMEFGKSGDFFVRHEFQSILYVYGYRLEWRTQRFFYFRNLFSIRYWYNPCAYEVKP